MPHLTVCSPGGVPAGPITINSVANVVGQNKLSVTFTESDPGRRLALVVLL